MAKSKLLERLGNTKTRTLVLFGAVILIVIVLAIVLLGRRSSPLATEESRAAKIPQITAVPGNVTSEKYQELQEEENRRRAELAKKGGGSAVATIIGARGKDVFAKKETFGIEDQLLKNQCKCPQEICPENLTEAVNSIVNDKEAAKEMIRACPKVAKLLADKNPTLLKQLILENGDIAKKIAERYPEILKKFIMDDPAFAKQMVTTYPEIVKELLKNDPDFANQFGKKYPELMKLLMAGDPAFAAVMMKQNPDMVKKLMLDDPAFARILAQNNPDMVKKLMLDDPAFAKALAQSNPDLVKQLMLDDPAFARALAKNNPELAKLVPVAAKEMARQIQLTEQQQKQVGTIIANMEAQAKGAFEAWNIITPQQFVKGEEKKEEGSRGGGTGGGSATEGGEEGGSAGILLKAGDVLYGVLDTAINSDEPSPILATIISGKFKGSKLVGSIQLAAPPGGGGGGSSGSRPEKVILNFSTLNIPSEEKSLSISAVAIDPDTSRTALASNTDHHYLLRYGTLLASSFLTGYAKVLTSTGTVQTTNSATGATTTTSPILDNRKQIFAAFGEVGQKLGEATATYFNLPNTITVDPGTGIGILILSDVSSTS